MRSLTDAVRKDHVSHGEFLISVHYRVSARVLDDEREVGIDCLVHLVDAIDSPKAELVTANDVFRLGCSRVGEVLLVDFDKLVDLGKVILFGEHGSIEVLYSVAVSSALRGSVRQVLHLDHAHRLRLPETEGKGGLRDRGCLELSVPAFVPEQDAPRKADCALGKL